MHKTTRSMWRFYLLVGALLVVGWSMIASFLFLRREAAVLSMQRADMTKQTIRSLREMAHVDGTVAEQLVPFTRHPDPNVRSLAVASIAGSALDHHQACPMLVVDAIFDSDRQVRETALSSMMFRLYPQGTFQKIRKAIHDPNRTFRANLPMLLYGACVSDSDRSVAREELKRLLIDHEPMVRHNAVIALWKMRADDEVLARYLIVCPISAAESKRIGSAEEIWLSNVFDFRKQAYQEILLAISGDKPREMRALIEETLKSSDARQLEWCLDMVRAMVAGNERFRVGLADTEALSAIEALKDHPSTGVASAANAVLKSLNSASVASSNPPRR